MNECLNSLIEFTTQLSQIAVNLLIQSSALIVLGLLATRVLKHHGSAAQSAILRATLVAVLVCPFVSIALNQFGWGGWTIQLPSATRTETTSNLLDSLNPENGAADFTPNSPILERSTPPDPHDVSALKSQVAADSLEVAPPDHRSQQMIASRDNDARSNMTSEPRFLNADTKLPLLSTAEPTAMAKRRIASPIWSFVYCGFGVCWILGTMLMLIRLIHAYQRLAAIRRESPVATKSDHTVCRQLASDFRVRPPEVRRNSLLASPCLAGIASPTILLPCELQDSVLLKKAFSHELAHLSRRDTVWNLVQRLVLAILFYQPLIWRLIYRLETTAEEVCDDFVVRHCSDRRGYAEQLVALAESTLAPPNMAGLGMFKSSSSLLNHRVVRILDSTRKLTTQISLPMIVSIVALTLLSTTLGGFLGNTSTPTASPSNPDDSRIENEILLDEETLLLEGQVLDFAGNPVSDAVVYHKLTETTTGSDGSFQIEVPALTEANRFESIVFATKQGFGLGFCKIGKSKSKQLEIDMPKDDAITGTLVDINGTPVVGAKITLAGIAALDDVDDFLRKTRDPTITYSQLPRGTNLSGARKKQVTTDESGKFILEGIGLDRLVQLRIDGADIARTNAKVLTRQIKTVSVFRELGMFATELGKITIHGHEPTIVCQPTQVINGVVVDRETGRPLAGVNIYSDVFSGVPIGGIRDIKVTSDAEGRFTLTGMPVGEGNTITAFPVAIGENAMPYLARDIDVPEGDGVSPVDVRVELQRGTWVRGKVIDAKSREPVANARVTYKPYQENDLAVDLYSENRIPNPIGYLETGEDGKFQLVALPGKALLDVWVVKKPFYPPGQGWGDVDEQHKDHLGNIKIIGYPSNRQHPTMMKEINILGDEPIENLVYELDPGKSIQVNFLDPEGQPLKGVDVRYATSNLDRNSICQDSTTQVTGLLEGQSRTLTFYHKERELGLIKTIRFDDNGSVTATLRPNSKFEGVLIDSNGDPISRAKFRFDITENQNYFINSLPYSYVTDEEGKFSGFTHPGAYNIYVATNDNFYAFARNKEFTSGESIDFGTVDIAANHERIMKELNSRVSERTTSNDEPEEKPQEEESDKDQSQELTVSFSGRVIDLYGNPVADVELFRLIDRNPERRASTSTKQDGSFTIDLPKSVVANFSDSRPFITLQKEGFGKSFERIDAKNQQQELILANDDHPIEGQLLDPEGNPISGVQVKIEQLTIFKNGVLNDALQRLQLSTKTNNHCRSCHRA